MDKDFRRIFKLSGIVLVLIAHILPFPILIAEELSSELSYIIEPDLTFPIIFGFLVSLGSGFVAGEALILGFVIYLSIRYKCGFQFKEFFLGIG